MTLWSRRKTLLAVPTAALLLSLAGTGAGIAGEGDARVPVLCYHRFGPTVADSMTIKTNVFEQQLQWLKENGYTVIPLRTLVNYLRGDGPPPPAKSVVITADDGHRSVYTDMLPLVRKHKIPVTLFIYPSAISNASYAMTWEQLREVKNTGLFDIQSHTYWHPKFRDEKKKMTAEQYEKFLDMQLVKSRNRLQKEVGGTVDVLAWPFGLFDTDLEKQAADAGYVAAFSIERRPASKAEKMTSLPRYMIMDSDGVKGFAGIVSGTSSGKGPTSY